MNSTIDTVIDTLNDLTETLKDGENGFRAAAKDVKAPELAQLFQEYAQQRAEFASRLQSRVSGLGASVKKSGSIGGAVHRGWMNVKAALSTNEPQAVLEEAERGEDIAVAAYRKALEHQDLDADTRSLLQTQAAAVQKAHNRVRDLRDSGKFKKK